MISSYFGFSLAVLEKSRKTMINFLKKTLTRVAQFHHIHYTRSEQRTVKSERSVGNLFDSIFKRLD